MKTKERTPAAGGRSATPTPQPGDRLPFAPRERKPALAALAVLLILVGALGATVLVLRAGNKVAAVQVTETVVAGQEIPASAIQQVMMPEDSEVEFIRWSQRGLLGNYHATGDIIGGSILVGSMLTEGEGLKGDQAVVGLSLKPGQYPNDLRQGNTVAAYHVTESTTTPTEGESGTTGTEDDNLLVESAKVRVAEQPESGSLSGGTFTVNLLVDSSEAGPLAEAASEQEVSLVLVPGSR